MDALFSLKNAYKSKVENHTKELSKYQNAIVTQIQSPFETFEFYLIHQAQFKSSQGLICIINDDVEIWSYNKNAFEEVLNYLNAAKKDHLLSIDQITFLHKILLKKRKQLLVNEENLAPFEKMARKLGFILSYPVRSLIEEEVHYNFWTYCFDLSTFIQNQIILGKGGEVQISTGVS